MDDGSSNWPALQPVYEEFTADPRCELIPLRDKPRALAETKVPATLRAYMRQQLRWNRSFYRELRWIIPLLVRRPPYITLDVAARFLLPLLLPMALVAAVLAAMAKSGTLVRDTVLLVGMAATHLAVVICRHATLGSPSCTASCT